ncbi:cytochrome P450 9e2-like [Topomyia yanbarensis]|uniref:cytochrome P450 9e2-like n=1 Tax=Topomyia yanbarensis TaxID=2498891 RepID=UPI00273AB44E|nr:cytochrome P450 9e2-like [Topomyia yanbarensis]
MELDLVYLIPLTVLLVICCYLLSRKKDDYFQKRLIPSIPSGLFSPLFLSFLFKKCSWSDYSKIIYDGNVADRIVGLSDNQGRVFALLDPELIKTVAVKNFDHFTDRRPTFWNPNAKNPRTILHRTLFSLAGEKWRNMRTTLSPAFTGSKMRLMFELVLECCENMTRHYRKQLTDSGGFEVYDMKDIFSRFSNDVIGTCAFGISVDSMKEPNNDFYTNAKKLTQFQRLSVLLRMLFIMLFPKISDALGVEVVDREQLDYVTELIVNAVKSRKANNIVRPDMIHLLMEARKGVLKDHQEAEQNDGFATVRESEVGQVQASFKMTDLDMVAQCSIFLLAGFETVSTCLTFLVYELTVNPDVQQRLYEEVLETVEQLDGTPLRYETLQKMKYMDMCVSESLRLWPPIPIIDRLCISDYRLDDGQIHCTIEKGAGIFIPIYGLHRDPKYFPEPERFDPERFSDENKASINMGAYLPFGVGPRNCIGSRFALMEVKAILFHMLQHFSFERTDKTPVPMKLLCGTISVTSKREVAVALKLRKSDR